MKSWPRHSQSERRQWQRYNLGLPIVIVAATVQRFWIYRGLTRNICKGGVSIYLPQVTLLEVGDLALLEFTVPQNRQVLHVEAIVRERIGFLYRLEFSRPTFSERILIERACGLNP
jgi:PilZ domain